MLQVSRFTLAQVVLLAIVASVMTRCAASQQPSPQPADVNVGRRSEPPPYDRRPRIGPMETPPSADWIQGRFTDLPIPRNFTLMADESFVFVQGSLRSADLNYTGTRTPSDMIRFYQESMPTNGWRFIRMTGVKMKTLSYLKGEEICEIIIERHAPHTEHEVEYESPYSDQKEDTVTHLHIKLSTY